MEENMHVKHESDPLSVYWDFCVVLPWDSKISESSSCEDTKCMFDACANVFEICSIKSTNLNTQDLIRRIMFSELEVFAYHSSQSDKVICKIGASLKRLRKYAANTERKFLVSKEAVNKVIEDITKKSSSKNIVICENLEIERKESIPAVKDRKKRSGCWHDELYDPTEFIFADFVDFDDSDVFATAEGYGHPFSSVIRQQIIFGILTTRIEAGGAGLTLSKLCNESDVLAAFPLHNLVELQSLKKIWSCSPINLPLKNIKNYFGEKIALYFGYLGHFTSWYISAACCGLLAQLCLFTNVISPNIISHFFSLFIMLWCVLMLEYWKRLQARLSVEWGTSELEEDMQTRPEYNGEMISSPITGENEVYFPLEETIRRKNWAMFLVGMCILFVISLVCAIYLFRFFLVYVKHFMLFGVIDGSTIASCINSIQIAVLNTYYTKLAIFLTDDENHRTDILYEDSLIWKLFIFKFVNTFSSFFYIAFGVKIFQLEDCSGNCIDVLSKNLFIIMFNYLVVGNAFEYGVPWINSFLIKNKPLKSIDKKTSRNSSDGKGLTKCEEEYSMDRYNTLMDLITDYSELAIALGFSSMFVAAFPFMPLLGLAASWFELCIDSRKLLEMQRPLPAMATDIGTWQDIFTLITYISVITNAGLIVFVMPGWLKERPDHLKVWWFISIQYGVFGLLQLFKYIVPDIPYKVELQMRRQILGTKVIEKYRSNEKSVLAENLTGESKV